MTTGARTQPAQAHAGIVYLLHFASPISPLHTAQHYLGYADDLGPRINAHRTGHGARLTTVARDRGIAFVVARTWSGTRADERRLKNRHDAPRLCPICNGRHPVQLPLLTDACAYIPTNDQPDAGSEAPQ